jgi:nitrite reductase/ring-hydroxylating ferredoxin subunit
MGEMTRRLIPLLPLAGVGDGSRHACTVDGVDVLVCGVAGGIYAVENRCSHAASRLDAGRLKGFELVCPLHGARFDIRDGRATAAPASRPIRTFEVILEGGKVNMVAPAAAPTRPKFGPLG